jgi:hypothetical protein
MRAPSIKAGRPRNISPFMPEALCDRLLEKLDLHLYEMELFLLDGFNIFVPEKRFAEQIVKILSR